MDRDTKIIIALLYEKLSLLQRLRDYFMAKIKTRLQERIELWAEGIKISEGWFLGSKSWRLKNPGNLKYAGQPGAVGKDKTGIAEFGSYEAGWSALLKQLEIAVDGTSKNYSPDMPLYAFTKKYADLPDGKELANYIFNITKRLKVAPEIKIKDIIV